MAVKRPTPKTFGRRNFERPSERKIAPTIARSKLTAVAT
jgi:hypothetical protein